MDDAFWDAALAAFLDLYNTINQAITTALCYAEMQQGERMTELCKGANADISDAEGDGTELAFQAFTQARGRRAPFAESITVDLPREGPRTEKRRSSRSYRTSYLRPRTYPVSGARFRFSSLTGGGD